MRLHVDTMDATLVDFSADGQVKLEGEEWSTPSLQETRAIIHAARQQIEALEELVAALEPRRPGAG
jgi:hypothetical protein